MSLADINTFIDWGGKWKRKDSYYNHVHFFQDFDNAETICVLEMIKKIGKSISKYCRVSQIPIIPSY